LLPITDFTFRWRPSNPGESSSPILSVSVQGNWHLLGGFPAGNNILIDSERPMEVWPIISRGQVRCCAFPAWGVWVKRFAHEEFRAEPRTEDAAYLL
jgi:hypothetical protein